MHPEAIEESQTGLDEITDPVEKEQDIQSSNVMLLLNKTPYEGKDFSLYFSYSGNYFTLYINPNNPAAGNAQFDQFLKENNINGRGEFYDLREVSVKPSPEGE